MDIETIIPTITGELFLSLFLKAFAILFSVIYLLYAIVSTRQNQVMQKTVQSKFGNIFIFISFSQVVMALGLILLAIVLL